MKPETVAFSIPDMTCSHCAATLRTALLAAFPGAAITIDTASHRLTVSADPQIAKKVILEAGYTPELMR